MKLSEQIRNARLKSGLTCAELASRVKITRRAINYYEKGKNPSIETLEAIYEVTGVVFKIGRTKR